MAQMKCLESFRAHASLCAATPSPGGPRRDARYPRLDINRVSAQATTVQLSDGRVDDGSPSEAPQVYLGDDSLSIVRTRSSAAGLI